MPAKQPPNLGPNGRLSVSGTERVYVTVIPPPMCDLPSGWRFDKAAAVVRCGRAALPTPAGRCAPESRPAVTSAQTRPDAECIVHRTAPTTHARHRVAR